MQVSVVMAGRNSNPALLKEAVDSVLNQTFQDFEFIIIDDGSDEPLEPVIQSISGDHRISVYRIAPSGLGAALNYGIQRSHGELIARIDDDDVALPNRFEKQIDYLMKHPDVVCLGTQIHYRVNDKYYPHRLFPLNHSDIVQSLFGLHFVMAHTSIMFRRHEFDKIGGYRISGGGQDLDLWLQLGTVGKLANLDGYLMYYTLSDTGLSVVNPKKTEAYLYALKSAQQKENYRKYHTVIDTSIRKLTTQKRYNQLIYFLRKVLILKVKMLGRKM